MAMALALALALAMAMAMAMAMALAMALAMAMAMAMALGIGIMMPHDWHNKALATCLGFALHSLYKLYKIALNHLIFKYIIMNRFGQGKLKRFVF